MCPRRCHSARIARTEELEGIKRILQRVCVAFWMWHGMYTPCHRTNEVVDFSGMSPGETCVMFGWKRAEGCLKGWSWTNLTCYETRG